MEVTVSSTERKSQHASCKLVCACGSENLVDLGPCRAPGLSRRGSAFESDLSLQIDPGRLYRCRHCFLGLRLPRPSDETIALLYESLSPARWKKGVIAGAAQQRVVNQLDGHGDSPLRVLDVGAFDGSFLGALPLDVERAAIEPSDAARELEQQGIKVLKPFLEPATQSVAGQYDIVTMFDVFEHLADPIQGMRSAMSYVRPGGRLFVGTGNMDHWSWRQTQGSHWYLDPIQHLVIGSRRHFRWQAEQMGAKSHSCIALGHQRGTLRQRMSQALTTLYFGARSRGGVAKFVVRAMNVLPALSAMSHKSAMPYTQQLHDHLLAEFVRSEVAT